MTAWQDGKTYEVEFSTEAFRHIFYLSCAPEVDVKTFAHAVFHFYDTPPEWDRKLMIRSISEIKRKNCLSDYLHVACEAQYEVPMPEENEETHQAVRQIIRQVASEGLVPMAIYDDESKKMMVYATSKVEVVPQEGAVSVNKSFSLFGDMASLARKGSKK